MRLSPAGPVKTIGWSMYLACSWTWCIGMFLPVLLVRDYGAWSFAVFAIPNCLGAALMGWVLSRPAAERLVFHHPHAVRAFSVVTVAFQVFFLVWLVKQNFVAAPALLVPIAVFLTLLLAPSYRVGDGLIASVILTASVLVLTQQYATGGFTASAPPPRLPPRDLLFIGAACVFGFLLCPYLDPTFLKARRMLDDGRARFVFTYAFLGPFLLMLLGSAGYAGWWLATRPDAPPRWAGALAPIIITLHVLPHVAFVVGVHCREGVAIGRAQQPAMPYACAVLLGLTTALIPADVSFPGAAPMPMFEGLYRLFLGAYALALPAYVWICILPLGRGDDGALHRGKLTAWVAGVVLAAPFYWMGFIAQKAEWLGPGVAIAILARFVARRPTPAAASTPGPA